MSDSSGSMSEPVASAEQALTDVIAFLPNLLAAVALGLVGWLAARFARVAVRRIGTALNKGIARLPIHNSSRVNLSPTALHILGDFVFWLVALLFLIGVASVLEIDIVNAWLARLVDFLPSVLGGALIIVIGVAASILLGQLAAAAAAPAGATRSQLIGRAIQVTVLVVAVVLGVGQTGLDMTLPVALIIVTAASVGGALTLAFALGAGDLVRDLIGAQGLAQHCELEQYVRVDGVEGRIVEMTATSLVIATDEGRVIMPARVFHERALTLLAPAEDG